MSPRRLRRGDPDLAPSSWKNMPVKKYLSEPFRQGHLLASLVDAAFLGRGGLRYSPRPFGRGLVKTNRYATWRAEDAAILAARVMPKLNDNIELSIKPRG